ncbi:MAG: winged helix-turn-helix domain-containing protein, partial [Spirochaetales bacterium]|nr:winged helix-turn-helix domain-containing protein [Spirochaetales bacterium]
LANQDREKISGIGRAAISALQVHRALMEHPIATSGLLAEKTGITSATANRALSRLEQLSIVKEITAQKRNRLFSYASYIEIIGRGTELPSD